MAPHSFVIVGGICALFTNFVCFYVNDQVAVWTPSESVGGGFIIEHAESMVSTVQHALCHNSDCDGEAKLRPSDTRNGARMEAKRTFRRYRELEVAL
jgi:hypothetical protein